MDLCRGFFKSRYKCSLRLLLSGNSGKPHNHNKESFATHPKLLKSFFYENRILNKRIFSRSSGYVYSGISDKQDPHYTDELEIEHLNFLHAPALPNASVYEILRVEATHTLKMDIGLQLTKKSIEIYCN